MIINELYIRILRTLRYLRTEHLEQPLKENGPCKCFKNWLGIAQGQSHLPQVAVAQHLRLCNHDCKVRQGTPRLPKSTLDFTDALISQICLNVFRGKKSNSGTTYDNDEGEGADSKKGGSANQQAQSTTGKHFTPSVGSCELLIAIIISLAELSRPQIAKA